LDSRDFSSHHECLSIDAAGAIRERRQDSRAVGAQQETTMPLIVGCFALAMPRVALVLVWLFSSLLQTSFTTILWPVLGLIFAPLTTLAYAYALQQSGGSISGFWLVVVVLAVLIDLGLLGSSRRKKHKE
jgi:hypothetical protein